MESVEEKVESVGHRMKRSPLPGAGLDLITDLVKTGKDISTAGGDMKDFMFSIASPILKSLSNDHNVHVLKGLSWRLLPQKALGPRPEV